MTDIEENNGEVEGLRAKNRELLNEVKQLKTQLRELQANTAGGSDELEKVKSELHELKTADGWGAVTKGSGALPEMAKYLRQELGATLGFDGNDLRFYNADGKILTDAQGRDLSPFAEEDVRLLTDKVRESFPGFWPRAIGAGSLTGDHGRAAPEKKEETPEASPAKGPSFGLR